MQVQKGAELINKSFNKAYGDPIGKAAEERYQAHLRARAAAEAAHRENMAMLSYVRKGGAPLIQKHFTEAELLGE